MQPSLSSKEVSIAKPSNIDELSMELLADELAKYQDVLRYFPIR